MKNKTQISGMQYHGGNTGKIACDQLIGCPPTDRRLSPCKRTEGSRGAPAWRWSSWRGEWSHGTSWSFTGQCWLVSLDSSLTFATLILTERSAVCVSSVLVRPAQHWAADWWTGHWGLPSHGEIHLTLSLSLSLSVVHSTSRSVRGYREVFWC